MAAPDLPVDLGERLHRDSGGYPFYVEELLATVDRGAGPAPGAPAWRTYRSAGIDLPCRIVNGVLERSRQLGPTGHGFLVAAAHLTLELPGDDRTATDEQMARRAAEARPGTGPAGEGY